MGSFASAAIIAPPPSRIDMSMKVGNGNSYPISADVTKVEVGDKTEYHVDGTYNQHGYEMTVHFVIDPDPTIFGNVAIRNTLATTQEYTLTFPLPVSPSFNSSLLSGSVGLTTTADATAATVAALPGDAIYSALIDGASAPSRMLLKDPFSLSAGAGLSNTASDSFGIPVPLSDGPVNAEIGIKFHFTVTPGDQAGITSQFTANPVPEPTALLGLAIGGLVLARRRK